MFKKLIIATFVLGYSILCGRFAHVIDPVADLLLQPLKRGAAESLELLYASIPASLRETNRFFIRAHQVLYNEQVDILEESEYGDEVRVELGNCFTINAVGQREPVRGWMRKSALLEAEHAKHSTSFGCRIFPMPIRYDKGLRFDGCTVVLVEPWHDPVGGRVYSAGTRFVMAKKPSSDAEFYYIYLYNPLERKVIHSRISKSCALQESQHSFKKARKLFVTILSSWAGHSDFSIPYVLGGTSFLSRVAGGRVEGNFRIGDQETAVWQHSGFTQRPYAGFDCSGLVLRAAQCAGLPYYFKNTTTVLRGATVALKDGEQLQEGDLFWIPGHIMVVADVKNNQLIEAKGYDSGFARVQKITIEKRFSNISCWKDIIKLHLSEQPLRELDINAKLAGAEVKPRLLPLNDVCNAMS